MSLHADSKMSLRRNVSLAQYTTMQVGGPATFFAEPHDERELGEALAFARRESLPYFLMGKGSNLVFPDEGYPGLVISFLHYEKNRLVFHPDHESVTASAGVYLYRFALACRNQGYSGSEFLASIPGTVGGALVMNAGFSRLPGKSTEISAITQQVTLLNERGEREIRDRRELDFGYRHSNLGQCIVLDGTFRLSRKDPAEIDGEIKACFAFRNKKQDLKHPSSGSIFKNPPPPALPAARMIDALGLKGYRVGGAGVSRRHANYFINTGGATARDICELIQLIQEKVLNAYQISLEPEVRLVRQP